MIKIIIDILFNSPFKRLKLVWYFGEIAKGTPYFLPRKWVKTEKGSKPVPLKYFGFNWNGLGWKTKWDDYRFEYNPSFSMVILGKQLWIGITPNINIDKAFIDSYWEAWLYWYYRTDKNLSFNKRMESLFEQYSCTWKSKDERTDHYLEILKPKYLKFYNNWKNKNVTNRPT
jgi:hypothetical protein